MRKNAGKSARKSKTIATKDLPASETRNVKGGFLGGIGKSIGSGIKSIAPAVTKSVHPAAS